MPAYDIPAVNRNSGLGTYEPDISQEPAAPAGYQWTTQPGNIFPVLQKIPNPNQGIEGLGILAIAAIGGFFLMGGHRPKISVPMP